MPNISARDSSLPTHFTFLKYSATFHFIFTSYGKPYFLIAYRFNVLGGLVQRDCPRESKVNSESYQPSLLLHIASMFQRFQGQWDQFLSQLRGDLSFCPIIKWK